MNAKTDPTAQAADAAQAALAQAAATADPTAAAAKPAAPRKVEIGRGAVKLAELVGNRWFVVLPHEVRLEDVDGHPSAWSAVAQELRPFDDIRCVTHDRTALGDFIVLDCAAAFADVRMVRKLALPPRVDGAESRIPDGYRIVRSEQSEPDGWVVVRVADGRRQMSTGGIPFKRREDAIRHLLDSPALRGPDGARYVP